MDEHESVSVWMSTEVREAVDAARSWHQGKPGPVGVESRSAWIVAACKEKLEREKRHRDE